MVLLAFSLQDQIEKYGAYVGIVSFFGLAILSLLYFAQAREVKRLRDWAGRAPERAAEVEALAVAHADEARRAQPLARPAAPAQPAQPAPAVAANGAVKLAPAEVAALAFARAAGVRTPHPPRPHPVPVAAAVPATEVAAAGAATAAGDAEAAQDLAPASNGHGTGAVQPPAAPADAPAPPPAAPAVPAPATPAARRADPPPAAPLRQPPPPARRIAPPPRRAMPARPARRESSLRAVVLTAVIGVIVLGAAAFAITRIFSGGGSAPTKPPTVAGTTTSAPPAKSTATPHATPALNKSTMRVAVYNGTEQPGLAGSVQDQLVNLGYNQDNVGADTYTPNQQRQASVVMYERGDRPAAATVAHSLNISDVRLIDSATQQLIDQSGKKWDVIVIVGADKSQ